MYHLLYCRQLQAKVWLGIEAGPLEAFRDGAAIAGSVPHKAWKRIFQLSSSSCSYINIMDTVSGQEAALVASRYIQFEGHTLTSWILFQTEIAMTMYIRLFQPLCHHVAMRTCKKWLWIFNEQQKRKKSAAALAAPATAAPTGLERTDSELCNTEIMSVIMSGIHQ